jgi:hypothetical protein
MGQFFQGSGAEGLLHKDAFQTLPDNLLALLAAAVRDFKMSPCIVTLTLDFLD